MMITIGPGGLVNYNARCVSFRWRVTVIHQIINSCVLSRLARRRPDIFLLCSAGESGSLLGAKRFSFYFPQALFPSSPHTYTFFFYFSPCRFIFSTSFNIRWISATLWFIINGTSTHAFHKALNYESLFIMTCWISNEWWGGDQFLLLFFRVTLKASCPMDLRLYPMDVQHCPLIIESCKEN